jgi:hypothetical protein
MQIMQRFKNGFLPVSFNDVRVTNAIRRANMSEITLRNNDLLNIPFSRLSMSNRGNFEKQDLKILREPLEFNIKLKKFLLNELPD